MYAYSLYELPELFKPHFELAAKSVASQSVVLLEHPCQIPCTASWNLHGHKDPSLVVVKFTSMLSMHI